MLEKKRDSDRAGFHDEEEHPDVSKLGAEHGGRDFERRDVNVKNVLLTIVIGIVSFVTILVGVSEYFLMTKEQVVTEAVLVPASSALRDLRAQEDEILNSYKILDASKNIYQIPISDAMKLMAEEAYQAQKKSQKEMKPKK